ncbi:MAG: hypothetical protein JOY73_06615 [Actinobacteria bacterium]|nr:hypothetical protein [Actinomycetota bacterium]
MKPLFGPRTVVEAAFLVAVPVIALESGLGWPSIVGAGAVAYVLVLAVEGVAWYSGRGSHTPETLPGPAPAVAEGPQQTVRVIRAEPEPVPEPVPVAVAVVPEPAPAPVPVAAPPPSPELVPVAAPVVAIPVAAAPRTWNIWDLERVAREHAGADPMADEERTFLLMYLRDFAGPDGTLPVDFDELVRQSFGAIVGG